jgi:NagD protein
MDQKGLQGGMERLRSKRAFVCDMDGVIYHGNQLLPGVDEFLEWLKDQDKRFLFLTNSSAHSPRELREKLQRLGMDVPEDHFYTSALATADFLVRQSPGCKTFVIGGSGLSEALHAAGISLDDEAPDFVVVGTTTDYTYPMLAKALHLVRKGAKLIGTNPDPSGPGDTDMIPGAGALIAPIQLASGQKPYFIGKPNPLMMRHALKRLGCCREDTVIVGDRMDTDIRAGIESEIETVLVLSGVTRPEDLAQFAYRPDYVLDSIADVVPTRHRFDAPVQSD